MIYNPPSLMGRYVKSESVVTEAEQVAFAHQGAGDPVLPGQHTPAHFSAFNARSGRRG